MKLDRITDGIVLDHIRAGKGISIYNSLGLSSLGCTVAIITNVPSTSMGRKDLIKIERELDLDLDILGFLDRGITVNLIRKGELAAKKQLSLPQEVHGLLTCRNPRCICSVERGIEQIFRLADETKGSYRCIYCEEEQRV